MSMDKKAKILVVDDEESIREFLEIMLSRENYDVTCVSAAKKALELIKKNSFQLVITDISMPEMSGIDLLYGIKQFNHEIAVIMMTAHGSTENAVQAMKLGASDYLTKPFQLDEMKIAIEKTLKTVSLERENRLLRSELKKSYSFENIVGNSPSMHAVFDLIQRVAQTKTNIMILGESGTGKELVAHAIHRNSAQSEAPFVVINCAAVPESLFESELFGHKKGAFTGAISDKIGILEQADSGTLFLDEVGDIPLAIQVKLLRAIQQRVFRPLGATEDVTVDVRFICATNKDLEQLIGQSLFREDLYYRLNVIQIKLPSLRERREDIPALANHFLQKFNFSMGKNIKNISKEALDLLIAYDFPGNVRELENTIERSIALESHTVILPESLPQKVFFSKPGKILDAASSSLPSNAEIKQNLPERAGETFNLEKGVEDFEKSHIIRALEQTAGVKRKAASLLGISFRSLRYRIEKYGISDPNPDESE